MARLFFVFFAAGFYCIQGHPNILTKHNGTWKHSDHAFVKEGDLLDVQCEIGNISFPDDLIELKWQLFGLETGFVTLATSNGTSLFYSLNLTSAISGIYFCYFRSLVSTMTVNIVHGVNITNGTAQTEISTEEIGLNTLSFRTLSENQDRSYMICECVFDETIHLDMISVIWNSPTAQNVGLSSTYVVVTYRDELSHLVGSRLALRVRSFDASVYGKYSCLFNYNPTGSVQWDVYLNVAPILRLKFNSPPPPLFATALTDPQCNSSIVVKDWMAACSVEIAYPPVMPSNHFWNWTNPANAIAFLRSSGRKIDNLELLLSQKTNNSHCQNMLVPQDPNEPLQGQTVFWCYAENAVGQSGIWWPRSSKSLLSTMLWPLGFLVLQVLCGIGVIVWECYCHRRKHIHYIARHAGRVLGTADARSLVADGPEDCAEHTRLRNKSGEYLKMQPSTPAGEADAYFWDDFTATGKAPIVGFLYYINVVLLQIMFGSRPSLDDENLGDCYQPCIGNGPMRFDYPLRET